jgi:glucokinase
MARTAVAADFGGTHLRAALVAEDGSITERREVRTPDKGGNAVLTAALDLLEGVAASSTIRPAAACIATAGLVDATRGRVVISPNIPGFRNLVLTGPVSERLGLPVYIENDASAAALGEHRFGAGRGFNHLIHVTAGTGIGGGLVLNGRLYRGARGFAGEIGHIVVDPSGPRCNCGSRGCLEAMVSGVAFAGRATRLLAAGKSAKLAKIVGDEDPSGEHLFQAALAGDAVSEAEIRHGGHLLGLALGGLVNTLNPEIITISGGLLVMGEMLFGPMRDAIGSFAYGPAAGVQVKFTELGEDAGLLGAAAVAFEYLDSAGP